MESSSSKIADEKRKQEEIRKQIALLQAQLVNIEEVEQSGRTETNPISPKRKAENVLLVPCTPSPKKRKLDCNSKRSVTDHPHISDRPTANAHKSASTSKPIAGKPADSFLPPKPAPSTLLSRLASLNAQPSDTEPEYVNRSLSFSDRPQPQQAISRVESRKNQSARLDERDGGAPKRDDRLALVEDLEVGPYDHKPPFDDPLFETLEPNSGIRLSSRVVSHEDIQDYLRGRYYLSPSRLYSAIRLLPDKQGYDVPVDGDWVTIAVVAERGPIKHTRAPVGIGRDGDDNGHDINNTSHVGGSNKVKGKQKMESFPKSNGKKYVNLKLIDFGSRSRSSSSATGGKAVIRGDAFLSLLLFESDGFDRVTREDSRKAEKIYKGGSKGAFEALSKVKEGDVIALLNSRILKPFQRSNDTPHPISNILALTPESASSIIIIGRSRDLGMCTVTKRDGKLCGSWCDKRVSDVCEWHVQNAVERRRAGRAEFSIGTSGMSTTSAPKRKPAYDPAKQWGLKPSESTTDNGSTYMVSGHVVSGSSGSDSRSLFVTENMGREGQAKAARKMSTKAADRALKALLDKDKEGMKAVVKAREVAKRQSEKGDQAGTREKNSKHEKAGPGKSDDKDGSTTIPNSHQKAYSAQVIKHLGFDPTLKPGHRRTQDSTVQKKLETLAAVQTSRKDIELGPRPGQRIRSGVFAPLTVPVHPKAKAVISATLADLSELEASDEELDRGSAALVQAEPATEEIMVDLDGSSDCDVES